MTRLLIFLIFFMLPPFLIASVESTAQAIYQALKSGETIILLKVEIPTAKQTVQRSAKNSKLLSEFRAQRSNLRLELAAALRRQGKLTAEESSRLINAGLDYKLFSTDERSANLNYLLYTTQEEYLDQVLTATDIIEPGFDDIVYVDNVPDYENYLSKTIPDLIEKKGADHLFIIGDVDDTHLPRLISDDVYSGKISANVEIDPALISPYTSQTSKGKPTPQYLNPAKAKEEIMATFRDIADTRSNVHVAPSGATPTKCTR